MRFVRASKGIGTIRHVILTPDAHFALCGVRAGPRIALDDATVFSLKSCPRCRAELRSWGRRAI